MVTAMFAVPGLQWDKPGHHLETFAGCMEVTKHEWMDWFEKSYMVCFFQGIIDLSHMFYGLVILEKGSLTCPTFYGLIMWIFKNIGSMGKKISVHFPISIPSYHKMTFFDFW